MWGSGVQVTHAAPFVSLKQPCHFSVWFSYKTKNLTAFGDVPAVSEPGVVKLDFSQGHSLGFDQTNTVPSRGVTGLQQSEISQVHP